jgi:hypothetical protein
MNEADLDIVRRAYAKQVAAIAGAAHDARIEEALANVRREDFLGPGPSRRHVGRECARVRAQHAAPRAYASPPARETLSKSARRPAR